MSFLKRPRFLDSETAEWQVDTFVWLISNLEGWQRFQETELVLPTAEFYPAEGLSGEPLAQRLFELSKKHAEMSDWPVKLEAQDADPDALVAPTLAVKGLPSSPAGTIRWDETDPPVITYNPDLVDRPMSLVATFAHELCHYLIGGIEEEPPGGWEVEEFATDLAVVFMGFGVFALNTSFQFTQSSDDFSQGWQVSRQGYLTERELTFAFALFCRMRRIDPLQHLAHMKSHMKSPLRRAWRECEEAARECQKRCEA